MNKNVACVVSALSLMTTMPAFSFWFDADEDAKQNAKVDVGLTASTEELLGINAALTAMLGYGLFIELTPEMKKSLLVAGAGVNGKEFRINHYFDSRFGPAGYCVKGEMFRCYVPQSVFENVQLVTEYNKPTVTIIHSVGKATIDDLLKELKKYVKLPDRIERVRKTSSLDGPPDRARFEVWRSGDQYIEVEMERRWSRDHQTEFTVRAYGFDRDNIPEDIVRNGRNSPAAKYADQVSLKHKECMVSYNNDSFDGMFGLFLGRQLTEDEKSTYKMEPSWGFEREGFVQYKFTPEQATDANETIDGIKYEIVLGSARRRNKRIANYYVVVDKKSGSVNQISLLYHSNNDWKTICEAIKNIQDMLDKRFGAICSSSVGDATELQKVKVESGKRIGMRTWAFNGKHMRILQLKTEKGYSDSYEILLIAKDLDAIKEVR